MFFYCSYFCAVIALILLIASFLGCVFANYLIRRIGFTDSEVRRELHQAKHTRNKLICCGLLSLFISFTLYSIHLIIN